MLILTRRPHETIIIGDDITITILGVKGNQVRCGITAPKSLPVHREEVYRRIIIEKSAMLKEPANEDSDNPKPNAERDFWKGYQSSVKSREHSPASFRKKI